MAYSLVRASELACDLVRLPHGAEVAQVLRTALACDAVAVADLSARHPGPHRVHRWGQVLAAGAGGSPRTEVLLAAVDADAVVDRARSGDRPPSTATVDRLGRALLGDVAAVDRVLRHEVLDWTWLGSGDLCVQDPEASRACDVLADAAASAYCSWRLDDATRRSMLAPYLAARTCEPQQTGHEVVDAALHHLARTDEAGRRDWREVVLELRPAAVAWAPAMHEAAWALSLAGRVRLAADVQLAAATAFVAAGFTPSDAARGVWDTVSGSVQALLCVDLLPARHADVLLAAWRRVHGSGPVSSTGS